MDISRGPKLFDDDLFDDPDYPQGPDSAHDLRILGIKSPERTPVSKLKPIRVAASSTSQSVDSKKPPKAKQRKPDLIKIKHKVVMPSINIAFGNPSISKKEALVSSNNTVISINAANAPGAVYRSKNTLYKMNNTTAATNVTITSKVPPTPVLQSMNSSAAEMSSLMSRYTNADGSSIYQMVKKSSDLSAEEKLRYHTRLVDSPNNTSYYESVDLEYNPTASFASSSSAAAPQPPSDAVGANSTAFPKRLHRFKKSSNQPTGTGGEINDEPHMMDIMTHIKPKAAALEGEGAAIELPTEESSNQHHDSAASAAVALVISRPSTTKTSDGINFDDEDDELVDNFDETAAHHEEVPLVSRRASVNPYFNKSTLHHSSAHHHGSSSSAESLNSASLTSIEDSPQVDAFATGLDPNVHLGDKDALLMAEIAMHSLWDGEHLNSHFTVAPGTAVVHSSAPTAATAGSSVTSEDSSSSSNKVLRNNNKRHHSPEPAASSPARRSPSPPPRSGSPTSRVPAAVSVVIPEIRPEADSPKSVQRKYHTSTNNSTNNNNNAAGSPSSLLYPNKKPAGSPVRSHTFLRNNLIKAYNLPMLKLEALSPDKEGKAGPASSREAVTTSRNKESSEANSVYQSVSARDSVESRILQNSVKTRIVIPSHTTNDPNANTSNDVVKKSVRIKDPNQPQQLPSTQTVSNRIIRKGGGGASKNNSTVVTDYYDMLKGSKQVASTAVQTLTAHSHPPTLSDIVAACETLQTGTGLETPASTAPHTNEGLGAVTMPVAATGGGGGSLKQLLHVTSLDLELDNTSFYSSSGSTFRPHASNVALTKDGHYIQQKNKHAAAVDRHRTTNNPVDSELSSFAAGVSSYESYIANHGSSRDAAERESGAHKFIKIVAPSALDDDEVELMASEYVLRPSTQKSPKNKSYLGTAGVEGGASMLDDSYDSSLEEDEEGGGSPLKSPSLVAPPAPLTTAADVQRAAEGVPPQNPLSVIANEANAAILTQYEYEEILDFNEVYFYGHDKYLKIQPHILIPELFLLSDQQVDETELTSEGMLTTTESLLEGEKVHFKSENRVISGVYNDAINGIFNNGFDNEDTTYIATKGDHVGYRYELLSSLGKGSFGDVFECLDHKTGKNVAVKIIKSKQRFQEQGAHELAMLDYVRPSGRKEVRVQHPASYYTHSYHKEEPGMISVEKYPLINSIIVQYTDSFVFRNHRCFAFPLYSLNLYEYMKLKNFAGLPVSFVKKVAVQLLEALKYLRSINVVHCDLKPENILLRDEKTVSIVMIDFGSSCMVNEYKYMYIQSRFYRAPEVLMGIPYGFPIDMWSVACILPELRTSYPAFPGESERDQVAVIAEVLGEPPYSMYTQCTKKKELYNEFYKLLLYISPLGRDRALNTRTMSGLINARAQDQLFVSFIASILHWLPEKRLTPADALRHPWLLDKHEGSSYFDSDATFQSLAKGGTAVSDLVNNSALHASADILLKEESSSARMKEKSDLEKMEEFIDVFKFDYLSDDDEIESMHPQTGGVLQNAAEIAEEAGVELMQTIEEEEGESSFGGGGVGGGVVGAALAMAVE